MAVVRHDGSDVKGAVGAVTAAVPSGFGEGDTCLRLTRSIARQRVNWLSDWIDRNPIGMGVNWTIAMEAALRAISICLTLELLWPLREDEQAWLNKVTSSLWQHLLFIEAHNEFSHFVRSNHYLSNIVGLTTLSADAARPRHG